MHADHITLTVVALYVSKVRGASSTPVPEIQLRPDYGIVGDSHASEGGGNLRQFTAVSTAELGRVAEALGVPFIDPAWIKANICFACPQLENFTETLIEGTKLVSADGRAVLEVKGAVDPCQDAGKTIAAQFPQLAVHPQLFPKASYGRRGVHGVVLEEVTMKVGDVFTVIFPQVDGSGFLA